VLKPTKAYKQISTSTKTQDSKLVIPSRLQSFARCEPRRSKKNALVWGGCGVAGFPDDHHRGASQHRPSARPDEILGVGAQEGDRGGHGGAGVEAEIKIGISPPRQINRAAVAKKRAGERLHDALRP
jgi:hypothetical protein